MKNMIHKYLVVCVWLLGTITTIALPKEKKTFEKETPFMVAPFTTEIHPSNDIIASSCNTAKDGAITVHFIGGTPPYRLKYGFISSPNNALTSVVNITKDQYIITGLEAGDYKIVAYETNSIQPITKPRTVPSKNLNLNLNLISPIYFCGGKNKIELNLKDPTILNNVIFKLDGVLQIDQFSNVFTDLPSGNYSLTIQHRVYTCKNNAPILFTINNPTNDSLEIKVDNSKVNMLIVNAVGGVGNYQYSFDGGNSFSNNNRFTITRSGFYNIVVKDSKGCATDIYSKYYELMKLSIPDYFSPNGDGVNDTWKPTNIELYPQASVKLYDRFGRLLKKLRVGEEWLGEYNGDLLPTGGYWYVIELNALDDERRFMGSLTMIR